MLLGDTHGQNLFVAHPTIKQSDVRANEALSKAPGRFVLSMLDLFFSRSTLSSSLATKKGKDRLDADIMEGLRRKLEKMVPLCLCKVHHYALFLHSIPHIQYTQTINIHVVRMRIRPTDGRL